MSRSARSIKSSDVVALALLMLVGCASTPQTALQKKPPTDVVVSILYATDRARTGFQEATRYYGDKRGVLHYGVCEVVIPARFGKSPIDDLSRRNVESNVPRAKRVVLRNVTPIKKPVFLGQLSDRINRDVDKSALVYVHGYMSSFEDAAKDAVIAVYLLRYEGAPIVFSWPSAGSVVSYVADATSIKWSTPHLRAFLEELSRFSGVETIHLVAHSMGNRALVDALIQLIARPNKDEKWKYGEVVLIAPDIDREIFERDLAPKLVQSESRITLYVSARDIPLLASKAVNAYPRLGDAIGGPPVIEGIDTVDVSEAITIVSGHAYYKESPAVIADMGFLINDRQAADNRDTVNVVNTQHGRYWKVRPQKSNDK